MNPPNPHEPKIFILRESPDAKWRLLELVLRAESRAKHPRDQWPEIILVGEGFEAGTLAAARALAGSYEVRIRYAESVDNEPRFHSAPDTSAMAHFFSRDDQGPRRKFHAGGQVRWSARERRTFAYIRQFGRFPHDEEFWAQRISDPDSIQPSTGKNRIRFRLHTQQDFDTFEKAVGQLATVAWTGAAADREEESE